MNAHWMNRWILAVFGAGMFLISPRARGKNPAEQFFRGKDEAGRETSAFFLTSSVLIAGDTPGRFPATILTNGTLLTDRIVFATRRRDNNFRVAPVSPKWPRHVR